MLKNYLKTTFRHLWRHRLFTILNVLGLAIGIAACWVIFRIAAFEFSYDADLPHTDHTYRLITHVRQESKETTYGGISAPIYQAIQDEVTGVALTVPVFGQRHATVEVPQESGPPLRLEGGDQIATRKEYFTLRPYSWLAGAELSALEHPESVVLTRSRARLYFPSLDPSETIGKQLLYDGVTYRTVTGVVGDLDAPSEFTAGEFFYLEPQTYHLGAWTGTNGNHRVYLQLYPESDPTQVLQQINRLSEEKWDEFRATVDQPILVSKTYDLLPMAASHFSTHVLDSGIRKASKPVLYGLIGIGSFLMLLACINFINLSTAQVPQRSKEIGIRKSLGGGKTQLIGQILCETLATVSLAFAVAVALARLAFVVLADLLPEGIAAYSNDLGFLIFCTVLFILTTLLSGGYPAWIISRLQPIGILRGAAASTPGGHNLILRKGLIIFQFTIAMFFIAGAMLMAQQLSYMLEEDMGFDKEAVVLLQLPGSIQRDEAFGTKLDAFTDELGKEPGVSHVALGMEPLSPTGSIVSPFSYVSGEGETKEQQLLEKWVDTAYVHLYQLELVAGRNLRISRQPNEYLINEAAAKAYGFQNPGDAVGKFLTRLGQAPLPVVGVVKDFHTKDFYTAMEPVILMYLSAPSGMVNIKLDTTDPARWQQTLESVEQRWSAFFPPDTYELKFYDSTLETMYRQERNLARLINLATGIALLISCLGLFGLASLTAYQRTKEIGIRKVLGAKVTGLLALLAGDFVRLVGLSVLIATPITWWAASQWLEGFAYRITIEWWVFALAGLLVGLTAMITVSLQTLKTALANPVNSLKSE